MEKFGFSSTLEGKQIALIIFCGISGYRYTLFRWHLELLSTGLTPSESDLEFIRSF